MKIFIVAHGTRGDVQPAFAMAHALDQAGHAVRLLAPARFSAWATQRIVFTPVELDIADLLAREQTRLQTASAMDFVKWAEKSENAADQAFASRMVEASEGCDGIIAHPLLLDRAAAVAEHRRVPLLPYCTLPLFRTRAFSPPLMGSPRLGPLTQGAHSLYQGAAWRSQRPVASAWRKRLRLPLVETSALMRIERGKRASLETYSVTLSPRPRDWGEERVMTGLVRVPKAMRDAMGEATLPPALETWLGAGSAPVFITFGSMPLLARPGLLPALLAALKARRLRAVVDTGWTQLDRVTATDDVYYVRDVNHAALLARCALALHHGGAGSTAAAAEAGVPAIVAPAFVDQPFWAGRVCALGIGTALPYRKLNERRFGQALDLLMTDAVRRRAREVGALIGAEDGLGNIARAVEQHLR